MFVTVATLLLVLSCFHLVKGANNFLEANKANAGVVSMEARSEELQAALGAVHGCTRRASASSARSTSAIRKRLVPTWSSLPKNRHGRVEWKFVRYMAHRHFMQQFNMLVRGLEPTIRVNDSHVGEAEVLSRQAPDLAKVLKGPAMEHGFSLQEGVSMIAALEQLLFESDNALLEQIYESKGFAPHQALGKKQLQDVMADFMVYWMLGDDQNTAGMLVADETALKETIPHWDTIKDMVDGSVVAMEYSRQQTPKVGTAHVAFDGSFTFEDALEVAGLIARNFGNFWEPQCEDTKASLVRFDAAGTGRVRLPDFYAANKDGEWRFGESEAYLRELGALDETSSFRGKQVVVSNYMQAASNCVVTRQHYLVCCMIECEWILNEVETAVGGPMATVEQVLDVVGNMTDGEDELARLDDEMLSQLRRMAQTHGGKLPLHGRLFAQWLHYAFPQECAFPHKVGDASSLTPAQFGDDSVVTSAQVLQRVADDVIQQDLMSDNTTEQEKVMTQWSEDEELLGDYSQHLVQWDAKHFGVLGAVAALVALALAGSSKPGQSTPRTHSV